MTPRDRLFGSTRLTFYFVSVIVISTMLGGVAEELFSSRLFELGSLPLASVFCVAIFAGAIAFLFIYWQSPVIGKLVKANADVVSLTDLTRKKYLITGYSPSNTDRFPFPDLSAVKLLDANSVGDTAHSENLKSWQQNARTISKLLEVSDLTCVYVINPDKDHFQEFSATLDAIFGDKIKVVLVSDPDDEKQPFPKRSGRTKTNPGYDDFDHMQASIHRALQMIGRAEGRRYGEFEHKVVIDITPGTKTYSMAASIATLNSEMISVYITSYSPDPWDLIAYDASVQIGNSPV